MPRLRPISHWPLSALRLVLGSAPRGWNFPGALLNTNAHTQSAAPAWPNLQGATAFVLKENLAKLCKLFATSLPRKPEERKNL